jgi:nucleoside-diphosphate-sugar epimerase
VHVLVAGCGYVGTALALRLTDTGHDVTGLRRDPSGLPASLRPAAVDLAAPPDVVARALADVPPVDAVVVTVSADGRSPDAYRRAYVDAPRRLLRTLAVRGDSPARVVATSSSAVWGQGGGAWVDESSPTAPTSATGRVLVEAERALAAGPFPTVVLRLTGIYGPGRTRLLEQVRRGEAAIPEGTSHTNRIHRDDAAGAIAHVLGLSSPARLYAVTDDDPARRSDVLRWLAHRLQAPDPPRGGPDRRRGGKRVSNARLRASGWTPTYPSFRDGYDAIVGHDASPAG